MLHILRPVCIAFLVVELASFDEWLRVNDGEVAMKRRFLILKEGTAALDVTGCLAFGLFFLDGKDLAFWITSNLPGVYKVGQLLGWCVKAGHELVMELIVVCSEET